jgi:2-dehydro-3-deoxyphosphogluconate aldolase / (4S)-4-hydroxy-2-oxoglutarate aldolase
MRKETILAGIEAAGIVAIVRTDSGDKAAAIAEACLAGGVNAIELTFTVPRAHEILGALRKRYSSDKIFLGAGTVLDPETARIAILEGADYIVAPSFNPDTVRLCNRYRVACMPGAMTIREIIEAMEAGADVIKVFPGETLGPTFIKAVKAPLPQAVLMPTGGVGVDNVAEWIKAGVAAVGVGGKLIEGAKTGDYASVTRTAKAFVEAIAKARAELKK